MKLFTPNENEEGSTLVITVLGMVAILGFAGLAIDVGSLRSAERRLQSAADAAAVAGALQISSCSGTDNCGAIRDAVTSAMTENGASPTTVLTDCAGSTGSAVTVMVNNPPCVSGSADPNSGKSSFVEVVATSQEPTFFARILGFTQFPVSARAEAKRTANPVCVFALDRTGGNAITVDLLASVNSSCGITDESSAWNALSCNLIASVSAPQINVTGGTQGFLCLPGTTPRTGVAVPSPPDPLSKLPKPPIPPCGTSTASPFHGSSAPLVILGTATLYPDYAYCGGITIAAAGQVTFMPGTYVLKSGGLLGLQGGLTISVLSNVTGNGVTFYNYGPIGGINFVGATATLGHVNLVAPTSGTYSCILFFQDPQNTSGANIIGSSDWNTYLQGVYYFPSANVLYAASFPVDYNILVAKDIEFLALSFGSTNLHSTFSNNYSSVPNGCPLTGGGSVLVQ